MPYLQNSKLMCQKRVLCSESRSILLAVGLLVIQFLGTPAYAQFHTGEYRMDHMFTSDQLREDLSIYKTRLEHDHPNLYLYTPKSEINRLFDSLSSTLVLPDNIINFYNSITLLLPAIKDGHTQIFPDTETLAQENQNLTFLPLQVHWDGTRLFVLKEYTAHPQIPPGTEILLINGISVYYLHGILMQRQIRDGYNTTYPEWIIDRFFSSYYSFHIGNPASFNIQTVNEDKTFGEFNLKALSRDSIDYYRRALYDESSGAALYGTGLTLKLDTALQTATMAIKDFQSDVLRKDFDQRFEEVIPQFFQTIRENEIKNLVLDLRNNQGGDLENGVTLLSYLLDKPFNIVMSYETVDPTTWHMPDIRLQPEKGPQTGLHQPQKDNFNGKLYVLINGGTFSLSSMVCSVLQTNQRCVFIGEETGGNPVVIAGNENTITLPNTKTSVVIPTVRYNIKSKLYNYGRGIFADYPAGLSIEDILSHRDPSMDMAYKLIKGKG